jgi:hypothetical protein
MTTAQNAPRFRTPTVSVDVDVSLDEFGNAEIANYLRSRGYQVTGEPNSALVGGYADPFNVFDVDALNHIETLSVCGQRAHAVFEALRLVGNAIGRPLQ